MNSFDKFLTFLRDLTERPPDPALIGLFHSFAFWTVAILGLIVAILALMK